MGFDYSGKTAVEALKAFCAARHFQEPRFLDIPSTDSENVRVTAVVEGRAYGTGEGDTSALACEQASLLTLSALLNDEFNPDLLRSVGSSSGTSNEIGTVGDGAHANALSLFNLYISAVARDVTAKPNFNIARLDCPDPKFQCVLTITIDSKEYRTKGDGRTKVLAKRLASYMLLRCIYPSCVTVQDLTSAVHNDVTQRRKSKRQTEISRPRPLPPSETQPVQVGCMNSLHPRSSTDVVDGERGVSPLGALPPQPAVASDEISCAVERIARQGQQEFGIEVPAGYRLRQATADDAVTIMALVQELAEYEKAPDSVKLSVETFARDGWGIGLQSAHFRPYFYVYLVDHVETETAEAVGMALFFPVYSTWEGKFLYLEDLYVKEAHRAKGIGCTLMRTVGAVAVALDIPRYQWQCLAWNEKPLQFYASTGAKDMADWKTLRLVGTADIARFVREGTYSSSAQEDCDEGRGGESGCAAIMDGVNGGSACASAEICRGGSWFARFQEAREVATESDKDMLDFTPSVNRGQDESLQSDEEQDTAGGFCQPKELAAFVNSTLKSSAAVDGLDNMSDRRSRKRQMDGDEITQGGNSGQHSDIVAVEEEARCPSGSGYEGPDIDSLKPKNIRKRSRR